MLVDGVMNANEVINLDKKSIKHCLIFKIDFEQAYDSKSWNFLDNILVRFGFNDKLRS